MPKSLCKQFITGPAYSVLDKKKKKRPDMQFLHFFCVLEVDDLNIWHDCVALW